MTDFDEFDDDYRAYFTDEELAETPAERKLRILREKALENLPKGTCWKCGEHIGRGIHFHVRACDGNARSA